MADVEFHHAGWLITIIENGIRVYKYHWCHCKDENGNSCGRRIPYPITISAFYSHRNKGIPKFILGHNSKGENNSLLGKILSKKTKKKISKANSGKNHPMWGKHPTEETRKKMRDNHADVSGENNPMCGKKLTEEHKAKISENHADVSGENNPMYGRNAPHGKRYHYTSPLQGRVYFRSSYELKYAKYLDGKSILWKYEHKTFPLSNGTTYTPDFYLTKKRKYIEIKGFMRKDARNKLKLFKKEYPKIKIKVLYGENLIKKGITIRL